MRVYQVLDEASARAVLEDALEVITRKGVRVESDALRHTLAEAGAGV